MAYEFKKLKDVTAVEAITDKANVLIEENGVIKKVNKSQVGDKISTATLIESVAENANVVVEEDGIIKRVHKSQIGMSEVNWNDLKDRPFGSDIKKTYIIPEQALVSGQIYMDMHACDINANVNVQKGNTYAFLINDVVYTFVYEDGWATCYENDETIAYIMRWSDTDATVCWNTKFGEEITFAMYEEEEVVTSIDSKYMPEGYPKLDMKIATIIPQHEIAVESMASDGLHAYTQTSLFGNYTLVEGECIVIFDGTEYECVITKEPTDEAPVFKFGDINVLRHDDDVYDMPFYVNYSEGAMYGYLYTLEPGTHTLSICKKEETITPIDPRLVDNYDLIITCQCYPSDIINDDNTFITGGSIDNVMAAFDEGRPPRVKIVYYNAPVSYSATSVEVTSVYVNKYYDEGAIKFLIYDGYNILGRSIGIGPQGLHSFGNKIVEVQEQEQ